MLIQAKVDLINRVKIPCPVDGVHVAGKDGCIKGVHALMFDNKIVFKGSNGFFWEGENGWGTKVYFSFGWLGCAKKKFVETEKNNLEKLYKLNLAPESGPIVNVKLNIEYRGKRIKASALGLSVKKVNYPQILESYAKGNPYDWNAVPEEWHTAKAFIKFREEAKEKIKSSGVKFDGSLKLGDVLPDIYLKRWFIVDAGR